MATPLIHDEPTVEVYTATAGQTAFPFGFNPFGMANAVLLLRNGIAQSRVVAPSTSFEYSVDLGTETGGTVTTGTPCVAGETIAIRRALPLERLTRFPNSGPVAMAAINREFDRHIALMQDLYGTTSRSVLLPPGEFSVELVGAAQRKGGNKILGFDILTGAPKVVDASALAKGDPGGSPNSIGLFTVASTLNISIGIDTVETSGWGVIGRGKATYIYDPAVNAAYVAANLRASFMSKNGRGFRLIDGPADPMKLGAAGDGVTDDTLAVQAAFDIGGGVHIGIGRVFLIKSKLTIAKDNVTVTGGGTLKFASWNYANDTSGANKHFRGIFVLSQYVSFIGIVMDATGLDVTGTAIENCFVWSLAPYTAMLNNRLIGCPKGTCIYALSAYLNFQGNVVINSEAAAFARGREPIMSNNIVINAVDAAFAINGTTCVGAVINGNTIANENGTLIPAMIAIEESASQWTVGNNIMIGVTGAGISALNVLLTTPVEGGTMTGNVIDAHDANGVRTTAANPGALINIMASYANCIVTSNKLRGVPSGNTNSCMMILPSTGTFVAHNIIDGTDSSGASVLVNITPGKGGIKFHDNELIGCAPSDPANPATFSGILVLLGTGDYGNKPVSFKGGSYYFGGEAINSQQNSAGITNLLMSIEDIESSTARNFINAANAIGDRGAFLNAGAINFRHKIGARTEMYCNAIPVTAGARPFINGDRFHYLDPVAAGCLTIVKSAGGSGWTKFGGIVA